MRESCEASRAWRVMFTLIVTTVACSTTSPTDLDPLQDVLFHTSYANHAWGFQSSGWYVDREGYVWRMSPPLLWSSEVSRLLAGDRPTDVYPATDLEAEYGSAKDSLLLVLGQDEVREMTRLVLAAAEGSYSDPMSTGADGGGSVAGALLYDPHAETYRKIVLSVRGDWTVVNESSAAAKLEAWLMDVVGRIASR